MSRRRMQRRSAPTPAGPFTLDVSDLAADARGVGHRDGKAVFVADTLPGEKIIYQRTRHRAQHDEGVLQELLEPSKQRVSPRCPHFGYCGGCALQHLEPAAQLEFKQSQLLTTLERIGRVSPESVLSPVTGEIWNYRRRARLAVKHVPKKGGVLVGFRERSSPFVAVLQSCDVIVARVGERLPALQELIDGLSVRDRLPQIEVAAGDNAIALVLRVLSPPSDADLAHITEFGRRHDFWFYLQPSGPESVTPISADAPALYYELPEHDLRIAFEPVDFVQVHAEINRKMVHQALQLLALGVDDHVLELFSGIGNFTLPIARRAGRVTSVEMEAGLVARAQANAGVNGLQNIEFQQADLFAGNQPWGGLQCGFNKLLLDPPRSGAREILPAVAAKRPSHIVYCSCHPATLARDAATLVHEHGYRLSSAGVLDMFPHTAHVEAMALFEAN